MRRDWRLANGVQDTGITNDHGVCLYNIELLRQSKVLTISNLPFVSVEGGECESSRPQYTARKLKIKVHKYSTRQVGALNHLFSLTAPRSGFTRVPMLIALLCSVFLYKAHETIVRPLIVTIDELLYILFYIIMERAILIAQISVAKQL